MHDIATMCLPLLAPLSSLYPAPTTRTPHVPLCVYTCVTHEIHKVLKVQETAEEKQQPVHRDMIRGVGMTAQSLCRLKSTEDGRAGKTALAAQVQLTAS